MHRNVGQMSVSIVHLAYEQQKGFTVGFKVMNCNDNTSKIRRAISVSIRYYYTKPTRVSQVVKNLDSIHEIIGSNFKTIIVHKKKDYYTKCC